MRFRAVGGLEINQSLIAWHIEKMAPLRCSFLPGAAAIGIMDGDSLASVTVFDGYRTDPDGTPNNIECQIASVSPAWVNKSTVRAILSYPFCQMKVRRVTCLIGSKNTRSLKFCNGLGFKPEGWIRQGFGPEEDLIVMGMLREESRRWLGGLLDV